MTPSNSEPPFDAIVVGARTGIGAALAQELLERGAHRVFATSRGFDTPLSPFERHGESLVRFKLDPTSEPDLAQFASQLLEAAIRPRLVIITSGVLQDLDRGLQPEKRLDALEPDSLLHAYRVNAVAPLLAIKHLSASMRRGDRFTIAALSARVGSIGDNQLGGWYSYRMSKAALNMGIRTAAIELTRRNPVSVCVALHPGTVATELSRPFVTPGDGRTVFTPQRAAQQLLDVAFGIGPEHTGTHLAWDGQTIPW